MKQTAVEWLIQNIVEDQTIKAKSMSEWIKIFEQAKAMEKERMYSEEDLISFAEFVTTYTDKNRNVHGQMLHAKSKYDGAERTVDLFEIWFEQFKNK
jgi:hypothetical protein